MASRVFRERVFASLMKRHEILIFIVFQVAEREEKELFSRSEVIKSISMKETTVKTRNKRLLLLALNKQYPYNKR